jgi:hypothetical protein
MRTAADHAAPRDALVTLWTFMEITAERNRYSRIPPRT